MSGPLLTFARGVAAQRYRDAFERSLRQGHGERRVIAAQAFSAARAALTPQQAALAEMALLRGQDLVLVAQKAGRTYADLEALLIATLDALQDHYRASDQAEAA